MGRFLVSVSMEMRFEKRVLYTTHCVVLYQLHSFSSFKELHLYKILFLVDMSNKLYGIRNVMVHFRDFQLFKLEAKNIPPRKGNFKALLVFS